MSESENCPKCNSLLPPRYSTGRAICSQCGWTDQPKKASVSDVALNQDSQSIELVPKPSTSTSQAFSRSGVQNSKNRTKTFGGLLFIVGIGMLGNGLIYDPTVSSGSLGTERTYNIGAMNIKDTYTNAGGFIAVCGALFLTRTASQGEEVKKENQEDNT